jgi:hypothetical protein
MSDSYKTKRIILISGNYNRWFHAFKNALLKDDPLHWDHVDPALPAPPLPGAPGAALTRFRKSEATCIDFIINTIDEPNFTRVQHVIEDATVVSPARDVWLALRDHHNHQSATIQTTCKRLLNASFFAKQDKDMTGWLNYNQTLHNRLLQHGGTQTSRDFIIDLVSRLPGNAVYLTYQTMVKMRADGPTMTIDHIAHELVSLSEDQSQPGDILQEEKSVALNAKVSKTTDEVELHDTMRELLQTLKALLADRDPVPECRNFTKDGRCAYGDKCKYKHIAQANTSTTEPTFSFAL